MYGINFNHSLEEEEALNNSQVYRECGNNQNTTEGYCPEVFDFLLYLRLHSEICWPETAPGTNASHSCPRFNELGFDSSRFAYKECLENGTWFQVDGVPYTDYMDCINIEDLEFYEMMNKLYVIGYSISVVALGLSLIIFMRFRSLRCTRIRIHTQLFASFILDDIMWILWYQLVVVDPGVTQANPIWCQVIHIAAEYFMVSTYMWMLCEGLHLHLALIVVFVREERTMRWFYAVGWGLPVLIVLQHTLVRIYVTQDTFMCWLYESNFSTWFLGIPILITLLLCTVFLIYVLWVILTIMHPNSPNPAPLGIRRAVRAALILIPLFGVQFLLLPMIPGPKDKLLMRFYLWLGVIIVPYQGLCCACLFCFANQDVIQALKGFVHRRMHRRRTNRWSNYRYTGAVDSAGVYVVNGHSSQRKSTDMTRL